MVNTINNWYGRLGNNIQQISNAIFFCKQEKINFYCPEHQLINKFNLDFGSDKEITNRFFFYDGEHKDFDCNLIQLNHERREICLNYIVPNFKFFVRPPLDDDTVVIHIRSGDIFCPNPHKSYVPNPLSFYNEIIEKFETAIIVTEDYNNPIIEHLYKNKKVLLQSSTIENDFATLLRARNLVSSGVGTFCVAAALCSQNIENFYCTDIFLDEHLNPMMLASHINVVQKKIENYIKIGDWLCTEQQKHLMLNYK